MRDANITKGVLVDDTTGISFVEVCTQCDILEKDLITLLEYGLLPELRVVVREIQFTHGMVLRIKRASRLRRDLGINEEGIVLALELLDKLDAMQKKLDVLTRSVSIE